MTWHYYTAPLTGETLVICQKQDGTVVSGKPEGLPEYLEWLAEGNTPEPWEAD